MKVRVPLTAPKKRPEITLRVHSVHGLLPVRFLVDTGADRATIPVSYARREGIRFDETHRSEVQTLGGVTRTYDGTLVIKLHSGEEFRWPCWFTEEQPGTPVLGREGLLENFAVSLDGVHLTITRVSKNWLGRLRSWWLAICHWCACQLRLVRLQDPSEPL